MNAPRRTQLERTRHGAVLRRCALVLGCLTAVTAVVGGPGSRAQTRLDALPLERPAPADNPTTPERVALGRLLFWDPILSGSKTSRARPAIIPRLVIRTAWISPSVPAALVPALHERFLPVTRRDW